jgi:uncharacterized protein (UPF0212 family)
MKKYQVTLDTNATAIFEANNEAHARQLAEKDIADAQKIINKNPPEIVSVIEVTEG